MADKTQNAPAIEPFLESSAVSTSSIFALIHRVPKVRFRLKAHDLPHVL
jgi:hypothetical protein